MVGTSRVTGCVTSRSIARSVGLATQASHEAGMRAIECGYGPTNTSTMITLVMDWEA
jgi:hypothetical protein